jgi:hypothetical protein
VLLNILDLSSDGHSLTSRPQHGATVTVSGSLVEVTCEENEFKGSYWLNVG